MDQIVFQAKAKENREARRMKLTPAHKYLFKIMGTYAELDAHAVEEFILDSETVHVLLSFVIVLYEHNIRLMLFMWTSITGAPAEIGRVGPTPPGR